jgi:hypothetical protein
MTLKFSRQNPEKYSNIKFHENPPCGSREGWTDRHDETNSRFFAILRMRLRDSYLSDQGVQVRLKYSK